MTNLHEAGAVLNEKFGGSFCNLLEASGNSVEVSGWVRGGVGSASSLDKAFASDGQSNLGAQSEIGGVGGRQFFLLQGCFNLSRRAR